MRVSVKLPSSLRSDEAFVEIMFDIEDHVEALLQKLVRYVFYYYSIRGS